MQVGSIKSPLSGKDGSGMKVPECSKQVEDNKTQSNPSALWPMQSSLLACAAQPGSRMLENNQFLARKDSQI
jgi:hypothetical protein